MLGDSRDGDGCCELEDIDDIDDIDDIHDIHDVDDIHDSVSAQNCRHTSFLPLSDNCHQLRITIRFVDESMARNLPR